MVIGPSFSCLGAQGDPLSLSEGLYITVREPVKHIHQAFLLNKE